MKLSVRSKLIAGFLAIVAMMVALGVIALTRINAINGNTKAVASKSVPSLVVIERLRAGVDQYRSDQLEHVLASSAAFQLEHETEVRAQARIVAADLEAYVPLYANAEDIALWKSVKDGFALYQRQSAPFLALSNSGAKKQAAAVLTGDADPTFHALNAKIDKWVDFNVGIAQRELKQAHATFASSRLSVIVLLVDGTLLGVAIAFVIARGITRGVGQMLRAARGIAVGDVEQDVQVTSNDELGDTALAFQDMIAYLRETAEAAERIAGGDLTVRIEPRSERDILGNALAKMIANLRDVVGQLIEAAATLKRSTLEMRATAQETAAAIAEQSAAVREAAVTADELSMTASSMAAGSLTMSGAAQQTTATMEDLRHQVETIAERSLELGRSSQEIGDILTLLNGIAEKTDLLALNASIEAVRAGEAGRGFAVVADEVRKLAERSTRSTGSIREIVARVQDGTNATILATERGRRQAEEITELMHSSTADIDEGQRASEQQRKATEQMAAALGGIRSAVEQLAAEQDVRVLTTESVEHLAGDLTALLERYDMGKSEAPGARDGEAPRERKARLALAAL
jgi:methyl-accepting chemotaxis protein